MNLSSIRSKLIIGGILIVLIPLTVCGYVANSKSTAAVITYNKANVTSIAEGLAIAVAASLESETRFIDVFAGRSLVRNAAEAVRSKGIAGAIEAGVVETVNNDLHKRFERLRSTYNAIFLTDADGRIYASAAGSAEEIRGIDIGNSPLFQEVKNSRKTLIGNMMRSKVTDEPILFLCGPVLSDKDAFIGTFGAILKGAVLTDLITAKKIGITGYCYMVNKDGLIIAHPDAKNVLQLDLKTLKGMEQITKAMVAGDTGAEAYLYKGVDKVAGYAPVRSSKGWSVAVTQDASEFLASVVTLRNTIAMLTLVSVGVAALLIFFATNTFIRPINKAVAGLQDIAQGEGDLTMRLEVASRDEVGELAKWFNTFIDKLQSLISRISDNTKKINQTIKELSDIASALSNNAKETSDRASNVATAIEGMNVNLNGVAAAMEQSTTNAAMVASAAEQMNATINQIAQNTEHAHSISKEAVHQASSTSGKMTDLSQAAQAIGKVTEAITEISEQTNLLALNATIEAARAGEAGKGFAVVANEIKELAKQTANATLDIKNQISGVQGTTTATIEEINQITKIINNVNLIVETISTSVDEQSSATGEIANNIAQASQGLSEVNENVSQSSAMAGAITKDIINVNKASGEVSRSSEQIAASANRLHDLSHELQVIVNTFKI
ncbi:MAG: methyl-accepting chemotaxis protein [Desulfobulbus sp.]|nr:methyl-accepting chemotaxis protein [Desulfobulbus sp.]